jgi:imidazole glycerol phosphate synthase subunit HisF
VVRSGTERTGRDAIDWVRDAVRRGAGEILLTSFDRDGTRSGYDLELTAAVAAAVTVPVIASGGADSAAHMVEAFRAGADAVLAASIFHDRDTTVARIKAELAAAGVEVRP